MAGTVFTRAVHTPRLGISVSDAFIAAQRTAGAFPAPLGSLECVILAQTAPSATTYVPPRRLQTMRHASGFLSTDGTWSSASAPPRPLGPGTYQAEIRSEFYRPLRFSFTWPLPPSETRIRVGLSGTAELMPGTSYPLPDVSTTRFQLGPTIIRGCLVTDDGTPRPDIAVSALNLPLLTPTELPPLTTWPFFTTRTSVSGDWMLILPGRRYIDAAPEILPLGSQPLQKSITVRFALPGGPLDVVVPVTLATDHSLRNTALRGRVTGSGGRPLAGGVITTSVNARQSVSKADGEWTIHFAPTQATTPGISVTATLPDGSTKTLNGLQVTSQATLVVPTFEFP